MLNQHNVAHNYREYTEQPLSVGELRDIFAMLDLPPKKLLRKRDKAYKALGLTGNEPDEILIGHFAANPTLLERPIGVHQGKAVVGRPIENLLTIA